MFSGKPCKTYHISAGLASARSNISFLAEHKGEDDLSKHEEVNRDEENEREKYKKESRKQRREKPKHRKPSTNYLRIFRKG